MSTYLTCLLYWHACILLNVSCPSITYIASYIQFVTDQTKFKHEFIEEINERLNGYTNCRKIHLKQQPLQAKHQET